MHTRSLLFVCLGLFWATGNLQSSNAGKCQPGQFALRQGEEVSCVPLVDTNMESAAGAGSRVSIPSLPTERRQEIVDYCKTLNVVLSAVPTRSDFPSATLQEIVSYAFCHCYRDQPGGDHTAQRQTKLVMRLTRHEQGIIHASLPKMGTTPQQHTVAFCGHLAVDGAASQHREMWDKVDRVVLKIGPEPNPTKTLGCGHPVR